MNIVKPKPKLKKLLQPITTDRNSAMSQSGFEAIACNRREARENARVQVAVSFGKLVLNSLESGASFENQSKTERSKAKPKQTQLPFDRSKTHV